jgi:type VI secretion system secreted protein VgrG
MKSDQPFRAERLTPKPIVHGPQTAVTVGPSGEIIHTDKYGRVKVQFHWDRYGKKDDKSSCWIRVSQNWGGKGWGGMFIPHVKQEVIIQFLEGDPDSPLITGRVYNAENMPPVGLPAGKTQSIIRDHGANEILMEGDGGGQRITMYSPTSETMFSIGAPKPK